MYRVVSAESNRTMAPWSKSSDLTVHLVKQGDHLLLPCDVYGFPPPKVTWVTKSPRSFRPGTRNRVTRLRSPRTPRDEIFSGYFPFFFFATLRCSDFRLRLKYLRLRFVFVIYDDARSYSQNNIRNQPENIGVFFTTNYDVEYYERTRRRRQA